MSASDISEYKKLARSLYSDETLKNQVFAFVLKNSGNKEEASTVFTDAVVAYVKSVVKNKNELGVLNKAYFFGIAKNCWYRALRMKKKGTVELTEWNVADDVNESSMDFTEERSATVRKFIDLLDDKCKKVLTEWSYNYSMREIAISMGYKSEMMARKKKYSCLQKLRKIVDEHPALKNQLF